MNGSLRGFGPVLQRLLDDRRRLTAKAEGGQLVAFTARSDLPARNLRQTETST